MKMLDKERRKKKHREKETASSTAPESATSEGNGKSNNGFNNKTNAYDVVRATSYEATSDMDDGYDDLANNKRQKSSQISNSSIHTEIRTDDFVVRLLFINLFCNLELKTIQKLNETSKKSVDFVKKKKIT